MTTIPTSSDLAARKNASEFFTGAGIKSLNDVQPHRLEWKALRSMAASTARHSRCVLDGIKESTPVDRAEEIEAAFDGLTALHRALEDEMDIRNEANNRDPRESEATPEMLARRPSHKAQASGVDDGTLNGGDPWYKREAVALKPEQRFATWAKEHGTSIENANGMDVGQFLRAMIVNDKSDAERRALAESSDAAGGYTVPDVLSGTLIDLARASSVVMQAGAMTIPLSSDKNTFAKVLSDPAPAWRLEAGAVANSDPTFGPVILTPRSLAVTVDISAELMADSLNLEMELPRLLAAAMAVELDRVALIGSGSAPEPLGVANVAGIGTFAQDAALSGYTNLSKARTGILSANSGPVSAYIMHPRDEGKLVDLVDGNGQPLMAPPAIEAIPKLTTTSIPIDGGTGNDESTIITGNFSALMVGIRSGIQVELHKGPKYLSNLQYTLIAHMRADIAVTHPGAFYTLTGVGRAA